MDLNRIANARESTGIYSLFQGKRLVGCLLSIKIVAHKKLNFATFLINSTILFKCFELKLNLMSGK